MSLVPLKIPPGVYRTGTRYEAAGNWWDSQLVRFFAKRIGPFGGWVKKTPTQMDGPARGMLAWRPTTYARQAGIGTVDKFYIWDEDTLIDVTPASFPAGVVDAFPGFGFGFGNFGEGPFGIAEGSAAFGATTWSMDTFGAYLLALATHSGVLYEYINNGLPIQPVANAPTGRAVFVTEEGIVVMLGTEGDLRHIEWSDLRDRNMWVPNTDNAAGDWQLQTPGTIVTGLRVRGGNLILTTTDAHRMNFVGGTGVFSIGLISAGCGIVAPLAVQETGKGGAIWMGQENFFEFAGGQINPIPCSLQDYIFTDINFGQATKFSSGRLAKYGEILFWYCSAGSDEIDRCVAYNEREKLWWIVDGEGLMARGCWADRGAFETPLAGGVDGYLYEQESGWLNDGAPLIEQRFWMTGPLEVGAGDQIAEIDMMLPDDETYGGFQVHAICQVDGPEGPVTNRGPYEVKRPYVDMRVSARQLLLRFESTADEDFRFGIQRVNVTAEGER